MGHDGYTFANGNNAAFMESLYEEYKKNPESLDESWRKFFEGYEFALSVSQPGTSSERRDDSKVEAYINTFRRLGYLAANLNPLEKRTELPENLTPKFHGLDKVPPGKTFLTANLSDKEMSFEDIKTKLENTYCRSIGADFRESNDVEAVTWLQDMMESRDNVFDFDTQSKKHIVKKLAEAEVLEHFLQTRYLGQKRFSVEGLESLIPLFDNLIKEASEEGAHEMIIGMAHRGRLNILTNILEKPYEELLLEFEDKNVPSETIEGDVKYHLGYANEIELSSGKKMRLYLATNPSHLEAINAPIEGFTRARQEDSGGEKGIVPILLHGDTSIIGQGVVAEVFNLSQLPSYRTGGTIHIITNNQIGFTTLAQDSRSCPFSSDISKMIRTPVFHVNADDPEAVLWVTKIAVAYRYKFKKDIVIDLIGYRRHGHNETDEPAFTQPVLYKQIAKHPSVFKKYSQKLIEEGVISKEEIDSYVKSLKERLNEAHKNVKEKEFLAHPKKPPVAFKDIFNYRKPTREMILAPVKTQISEKDIKDLAKTVLDIRDGFHPHSKIQRLLDSRKKMTEGEGNIDWAFAELLAFASLAKEGYAVRLSGQDSKRGTFSSRHAVLMDAEDNKPFELLKRKNWKPVDIINSPLSELGCLGFEFGYSVANPSTLVLWEAQFGDFVNGAQILLDQFLVASEAKWQQTSGMVLLLPHGHEGMGPEHSSARPERFLQSCGDLNIQVVNLTSASQLFHALRRQMLRDFRKPLVIFTPKSTLRHPKSLSPLKDFSKSQFQEVLKDPFLQNSKAKSLLMCTGKIFFELDAMRDENPEFSKTPILRLEQMYPFPYETLSKTLEEHYPEAQEIVWVQEEPKNMGAWDFVQRRLEKVKTGLKTLYAGRQKSGSTAEGSARRHRFEQTRILTKAFELTASGNKSIKTSKKKS